jgi:uncharacterized protein YfaP (DUF2135 family)
VFSDAADPDRAFLAAVAEAQIQAASERGEWKAAQGTVRARKIVVPDNSIEFTTADGYIDDYYLTNGREEVTLVAV